MDICQYVNSKAIREHLRKIGYHFNSLEAIWLVYQNSKMTFDEKCKAWEEIMANMRDMPYPEKKLARGVEFSSIFKALKDYIEYKKKSIDIFKKQDADCYYEFVVKCYALPKDDYRYHTAFKTYDDLINYIKANREEVCFMPDFRSEGYPKPKYPIDVIEIHRKRYADERQEDYLYLNSDLIVTGVYMLNEPKDEENDYIYNILYMFFDSMWFKFPTPFKKGDILYDPRNNNIGCCNSGPFVFEEICERGIDISDMTAYGHFLWEDGTVYYECMHEYMNLEYYDGDITGIKRTLLPLSNYLKGEIALDLCVRGYHNILMQESMKADRESMCYTKEGLELMGVDDDKGTNNKKN